MIKKVCQAVTAKEYEPLATKIFHFMMDEFEDPVSTESIIVALAALDAVSSSFQKVLATKGIEIESVEYGDA